MTDTTRPKTFLIDLATGDQALTEEMWSHGSSPIAFRCAYHLGQESPAVIRTAIVDTFDRPCQTCKGATQ